MRGQQHGSRFGRKRPRALTGCAPTTYADYKAAPGYGYDNVSGLAFLLFANECVISVMDVTAIVITNSITYVTYCNYFA